MVGWLKWIDIYKTTCYNGLESAHLIHNLRVDFSVDLVGWLAWVSRKIVLWFVKLY